MIFKSTKAIGQQKERLAEQFLSKQGLTLITRNFLCKSGEIDLIMSDAGTCVFVEVRYRRSTLFGRPEETVNYSKRQKLERAAAYFMLTRQAGQDLPCRFDVIAISGRENQIQWIQNAFSP